MVDASAVVRVSSPPLLDLVAKLNTVQMDSVLHENGVDDDCSHEDFLNMLYDRESFLECLEEYCDGLPPNAIERSVDWDVIAEKLTSRSMYATAETALNYWKKISSKVRRMRTLQELISAAKSGSLHLGCVPTALTMFLQSHLPAISQKHPSWTSEKLQRRLMKRWTRLDEEERQKYTEECLLRRVSLFHEGKLSQVDLVSSLDVSMPPPTVFKYFVKVKSTEMNISLSHQPKGTNGSSLWKSLSSEEQRKYEKKFEKEWRRFMRYVATLPAELRDIVEAEVLRCRSGRKGSESNPRAKRKSSGHKPLTSVYQYYQRCKLASLPKDLSFGEKVRSLAAEWREMPEMEKAKWKGRYNIEKQLQGDPERKAVVKYNWKPPTRVNNYRMYLSKRMRELPADMPFSEKSTLVSVEWKSMTLSQRADSVRSLSEDAAEVPDEERAPVIKREGIDVRYEVQIPDSVFASEDNPNRSAYSPADRNKSSRSRKVSLSVSHRDCGTDESPPHRTDMTEDGVIEPTGSPVRPNEEKEADLGDFDSGRKKHHHKRKRTSVKDAEETVLDPFVSRRRKTDRYHE